MNTKSNDIPDRLVNDIIAGFPEGIWVTDQDDRMIFFNRAMEIIAGVSAAEMIGRKVPDDFPEETIRYFIEYYNKAKTTLESVDYEAEVVTPAGKRTVQGGWCIPRTSENGYAGIICTIQDITRRRQAESDLVKSETMLKWAQATAHIGHWVWDVSSSSLTWSDEIFNIFGVDRGNYQITAENFEKTIHPDDLETFLKEREQMLAEDSDREIGHRIVRPDGEIRFVIETAKVVRDKDGQVECVMGTVQDITERKRAEHELKRTLEATTDGIWTWEFKTDKLSFSSKYYTMLGYEPDEFPADFDHWIDLIHPDDRTNALAVAQEYLKTKPDIYESEFRLRTKTGNYKWIRTRARVVERDDNGDALYMIGNHEDINDRKQAEMALNRSESLLETTGRMARVGGWELDTSTNEVTWTKETYRIHEVPFEERPPLEKALEFWHPDDRPVLADAIERARTEGEPYDLKLRFITAKGHHLHTRTICRPIIENGNVVKLLGTFQDITEKEQLLNELETFFSMANALICIADINSATFIRTNPAFYNILGYTEQEMNGRPFADFIHPEDQEPTARVVRESLQKGEKVHAFENRHRHKDGTYRWLLWNSSPIPEQGITYAIAIDITALKASQDVLQNAQRLESIGALAAGIAHDFNNLLGGIFGNIDLALEDAGNAESVRTFLSRGMGAMDRAKDLTQQLLTFSKGGSPTRSPVDICSVLRQSQQLSLSGSNVVCTIDCDSTVAPAYADENQLSQVFNNVMINAKQAMPTGGKLHVSLENCTLETENSHDLNPGEYIRIVFADEGEGIPDSHIRKVFDPFFTTKSAGSGLGLATSYSIVRKHDGTMHIDSVLTQGTTVTIYLPSASTKSLLATKEGKVELQFSGRILIMDDEEVMRDVAKGMLELLGFEVVCTRGGTDAIEVFKKYKESGKPFDVTILDLTVPGDLGGEQTMREIAKIDSDVPGIVSSGYADNPVLSNPEKYGFAGKIEKPYRKVTLSKVLHEILGKKKKN